jgi:hypothetical protein
VTDALTPADVLEKTLYQRGEWGVQEGRMHVSRNRPNVRCYRVVHLPSDRFVMSMIGARRDAEFLTRWLADEVPTLRVAGDAIEPPEAVVILRSILEHVQGQECVGARFTRDGSVVEAFRSAARRWREEQGR